MTKTLLNTSIASTMLNSINSIVDNYNTICFTFVHHSMYTGISGESI